MTNASSKVPAQRSNAQLIWDRCLSATQDHGYVRSKHGFTEGLRVLPDCDDLEISGERMAGALVVPCWSTSGNLASLQFVMPPEVSEALRARKKPTIFSLPGGSMDGYFSVGKRATTGSTVIVENLSQAWSIHRASGNKAIVLFSISKLRDLVRFLCKQVGSSTVIIAVRKKYQNDVVNLAQHERVNLVCLPDGVPGTYGVDNFEEQHGTAALADLLASAWIPKARYTLLSGNDIKLMPPIEWRVRSVLPAKGLAAIYGPSGSGKSFLALDLAAAIATGQRWFGCRINSAPVVYVALEGEAGFRVRVEAWEKHHQEGMPESISFLIDQFRLAAGAEIAKKDLEDLVSVVPKGAVVVLDTLNRAAPMSDENSSKDMGAILEASKRLQELVDGLVILIHHSGKNVSSGLRGHSSLLAALDAVIEVKRDHDRRSWSVAKSKDDVDGNSHFFKLKQIDLGLDQFGEKITSCVIGEDDTHECVQKIKIPSGPIQKIAYDALTGLLSQPFRKNPDTRPEVVPINVSFLTLEESIREVAGRLTCPSSRRVNRARGVISSLVAGEFFVLREDYLWKNQK